MQMICNELKLKSLGTVDFILKRKTWAHVEIDPVHLEKVNELSSGKYYFNRIICKHVSKQECLEIFLRDLILTKNITASAKKINMSAAHACDILNNKYWNDVPICEKLYEEVKSSYPNFDHSIFLIKK